VIERALATEGSGRGKKLSQAASGINTKKKEYAVLTYSRLKRGRKPQKEGSKKGKMAYSGSTQGPKNGQSSIIAEGA